MYLTYAEYAAMGGAVEEAAFPKLEFLAEQKMDRFTQHRVAKMSGIPQTVKYCIADLIDALAKIDMAETASGAPMTGFSNDGYSETYSEAATAVTQDRGLSGIVMHWLAAQTDDDNVPLLYLGVDG